MKAPHRVITAHYVYGVDASSSASVAVYIRNTIKLQEVGKVKITKAIFCIWDSILKRDIRVQSKIPGGTHVYAIDNENQKMGLDGIEWNYVFLSSLLRSFEPI